MKSIARVGDTVEGICRVPVADHPRQFVGHWVEGSDLMQADGLGIIRVGDTGVTDCGHTFHATGGSPVSFDRGVALHRVGDAVEVVGGGEGITISGSSICKTE